MALVKDTLKAKLTSIYEKGEVGNPSPAAVGMRTAGAYLQYCSGGQNAAGLPFLAMPGSAKLGQDLANIYSKESPSGAITAQKMAKAFDACLATFMSQFQNTIISTPFKGLLYTHLTIAFGKPANSASDYAKNLAMALHLATTAPAIQVIGVVPGTPPVPFAGPIT